jgi:hypothetical protein
VITGIIADFFGLTISISVIGILTGLSGFVVLLRVKDMVVFKKD